MIPEALCRNLAVRLRARDASIVDYTKTEMLHGHFYVIIGYFTRLPWTSTMVIRATSPY